MESLAGRLQRLESKTVRSGNLDYTLAPFRVVKIHPAADEPMKERPSNVAWDVTLIGRYENRVEDNVGDVNYFNTGLQLAAPDGFYFEMSASESLHKAGYMLATGMTIINPDNHGEVLVPLYKFKAGDDIELPFRGVQIVLRPAVYAHALYVPSLDDVADYRPPARGAGRKYNQNTTGMYAPAQQEDDYDILPPPRASKTGKARTTGARQASNHML